MLDRKTFRAGANHVFAGRAVGLIRLKFLDRLGMTLERYSADREAALAWLRENLKGS